MDIGWQVVGDCHYLMFSRFLFDPAIKLDSFEHRYSDSNSRWDLGLKG
jgi:hypothetical protein